MVTTFRELRRRKLLSQKELAEAVGTSYQTIQRWESGESTPRTPALRRLCAVFGVSAEDLLAALEATAADGKAMAAA